MEERQKPSSFAVISIVFGCLGLLTSCCYGGILGIVGLVFGIFVFVQNMQGKQLATVGVITSAISILITILMVMMASNYLQNGGYEEMNKMMGQFQKQIEQQNSGQK